MDGLGPNSADKPQLVNTEKDKKLEKQPETEAVGVTIEGVHSGTQDVNGTTPDALANFKNSKSNDLSKDDIIPSSFDVKFPEQRNRIVAEFYGSLQDAGGFQSLEDNSFEEDLRLEKLGILHLEGKCLKPTPLMNEKIPELIEHKGGKYDWLKYSSPDEQDEILDTIVTGNRDGRRIDALHFMNRKKVSPEALEKVTGVDARDLLCELDQYEFVNFTRDGVETTSKGQQLTHFLNETYDIMTKTARERAEQYIQVADTLSGYEDQPILEETAVNISGHRELIRRYIADIEGEIPEELEAFEDY